MSWAWAVVGPFVGLLLITALFAALTRESATFLTIFTWRTIAVQSVIVATAALGMTLIMISEESTSRSAPRCARDRMHRTLREKGRPQRAGVVPGLAARCAGRHSCWEPG